MTNLLLVGVGGFIGSIFRYALSGWTYRVLQTPWFPYGTIAVNIVGCLLIGFLAGFAESRQVFVAETRLFLFISVLGGFTTFSTFGYETFALLRAGQLFAATSNVLLHVIAGLAAVWLGYVTSRFL